MKKSNENLDYITRDVEISKTILFNFKKVRETHEGYTALLKQIETSLNRVYYLKWADYEGYSKLGEEEKKELKEKLKSGYEIKDPKIRYYLNIFKARCEIGLKRYDDAGITFFSIDEEIKSNLNLFKIYKEFNVEDYDETIVDFYNQADEENFMKLHKYVINLPLVQAIRRNHQKIRHGRIKDKVRPLVRISIKGLENRIEQLEEANKIDVPKEDQTDEVEVSNIIIPKKSAIEERDYPRASVA